jgi:hypothetical protein
MRLRHRGAPGNQIGRAGDLEQRLQLVVFCGARHGEREVIGAEPLEQLTDARKGFEMGKVIGFEDFRP